MEFIELRDITKHYGSRYKTAALQGFSCTVKKGELAAVIGKSGSGKSTMLNLIAGIDSLEGGSYHFQGTDMRTIKGDRMTLFRRKHIGFVLQHFALIPDYTVYENIAFPLRLQHRPKAEIREQVALAAKDLSIENLLRKYPGELSGGEAQRAAIARACIHRPELILADEPTGALDEKNSRRIMEIFQKLNQQGNTIILVTHDMTVARSCGRIIQIRDGRNMTVETKGGLCHEN